MLCPVNKYLVVEPILQEQKQSGVLVPDDYRAEQSPFCVVKLLAKSAKSKLKGLSVGARVVVPAHMVEEVDLFGEVCHVVLENNVVGYFDN